MQKDNVSENGSSSTARKERERPLHELLSRDMVDLYVGPENTHWILHEKLLCHRSRFFRNIFYNDTKKGGHKTSNKTSTYGFPDEDDAPFNMFVAWLYSDTIPAPAEEKNLGTLFDLYLMGEKWEIRKLVLDVLDAARRWYHSTHTWPSLRRVQYIYANTELESPMRQLLVSCVARMLVLGDGMPSHWENALRKNGQLAVDVILCVQKWGVVKEADVPDAREESVVPFLEDAEHKVEVKREEGEHRDEHKEEGANEFGRDSGYVEGVNGINGHDEE